MPAPSSSWSPSPVAARSRRTFVGAARHRLSSFRGLGDLVAWALMGLGISIRGACGCDRRQTRLNRLIPFRFTGKSIFDRRPSIAVTATLENRLGVGVKGRIQIRAGDAAPRIIEFAEVPSGGTSLVLGEWLTNPRARDGWS